MWERWNGDQMKDDPSMNSYNHYAYGAWPTGFIATRRALMRLRSTRAFTGWCCIRLRCAAGHVAFDYASAYGPIHSDWTVNGTTAEWHVTIPANTTGWLGLNASEAAKYKLDGAPLTSKLPLAAACCKGDGGFELDAGSYALR